MKFENKLLIVLLVSIFLIVFTSLADADGISWKFDDTPTIEECVRDSQNTYDVCEILSKMANDSIKKNIIYVSTFKEDE